MSLSQLFRPISISLSPNVQSDDVRLCVGLLLKPKSWICGNRARKLEDKFKEYLNAKYAFSFNSGRSALFVILKALDINDGDEVLLQAFTCNAVPNPVLWSGGRPVYVDVDESLNIDPIDLERKITSQSRAIIVQHTFGIPAKIDTISEIAQRHNLVLVEDCAHALGAEYNGKPVGTFGDISFFSFGRDKVISSVWGGAITTNQPEVAQKIKTLYDELKPPSLSWTLKQLFHPILFSIIIPTYYICGKYFLIFLRTVRGVELAVSQEERRGQKPNMFPARMPNAFAGLALHQFEKLQKYNEHRRKIAAMYSELLEFNSNSQTVGVKLQQIQEGAIYLRFNIRHPRARELIQEAKRRRILLGDWYSNIIDPKDTDFEKMNYIPGSCPNAEKAARESINLPTHINISTGNAKRITQYIRNYE